MNRIVFFLDKPAHKLFEALITCCLISPLCKCIHVTNAINKARNIHTSITYVYTYISIARAAVAL